ncbi:response regulator receiver and SARP domain protein [Coriobacterium glomerans PW2]|uniref:Response regulator receiver and SARP domain protein n=1 Tax=Coriobacterium glomerans (strain ATCC 49209 / DSM 20642 / JCM 10262 / PW2) TaxID=700015 RepID=F2NAQ9_CORGP|nr:hypothetical protein [Coriobacterium glomerans]AEB07515.1 response regulator receiver and SARP domain protein [Coriobacterium glomerans PW2]
MSFDPMQEDCLRLILQTMKRRRVFPLNNSVFIEECMTAFDEDPSQLIVSDSDRSFHLVAKAAGTIDYAIPAIADDAEAEAAAEHAEFQLREAIGLDGGNWDARRMLAAMESESNEEYVDYLLAHEKEVEQDAETCLLSAGDVYSREFADDLGRRPYLRWLAAIASRAFIAGRYTLALRTAERSLARVPSDPADIRFTAMLAMAKLERPRGDLKRLGRRRIAPNLTSTRARRRHHSAARTDDAWAILAALCMSYHALDLSDAAHELRSLMRTYPNCADMLFYQPELPDGVFARVGVEAGSKDELILALSEATPLLQEGPSDPESPSLATWIATSEIVQREISDKDLDARIIGYPLPGDEN